MVCTFYIHSLSPWMKVRESSKSISGIVGSISTLKSQSHPLPNSLPDGGLEAHSGEMLRPRAQLVSLRAMALSPQHLGGHLSDRQVFVWIINTLLRASLSWVKILHLFLTKLVKFFLTVYQFTWLYGSHLQLRYRYKYILFFSLQHLKYWM